MRRFRLGCPFVAEVGPTTDIEDENPGAGKRPGRQFPCYGRRAVAYG